MDIFKKSEIVLGINVRLKNKYGVDYRKALVTLSPDQNKVQYHYRYNGQIKSKIMKCDLEEFGKDLTAYCGLDPVTELIIVMTDQIALEMPKDLFSNLKWVTGRSVKWYPVSEYSSSEDSRSVTIEVNGPKELLAQNFEDKGYDVRREINQKINLEEKWERIGLLRNAEHSPDISPETKEKLIQQYEDIVEKLKSYMYMFPNKRFGGLVSIILGVQRKFPEQRIWIYNRCGWSIMCGLRTVMGLGEFIKLLDKKFENSYTALAGEVEAQKILQDKVRVQIQNIKRGVYGK